MNGEVCCILGVCCPPEQRAQALANEMEKDGCFDASRLSKKDKAYRVAAYIFKHFDLVPAGTGVPLMKAAAAHAKKK